MNKKKFVLFFNEVSMKDVPLVGGKNASLGEMFSNLTKKGVRIPNGFATTSAAYEHFLTENNLQKQIKSLMKGLDTNNVSDLMKRGAAVRKVIMAAKIPADMEEEIIIAYDKLSKQYKDLNIDVAVRSSATAEDLPDASFAGQQETFLNVRGEKQLMLAVKKCIASLFTNRAISYREDKNFDHFSISLSVGVQKMVRADKGASGVMFSMDTESGFEGVVLVNSIYGLGENIVQGKVTPDEYLVFKETNKIISRSIGRKSLRMIYNKGGRSPVKNIPVSVKDASKAALSDEQVIELAKWAVIIENHYKKPMDMEFAYDGVSKKMYITQARPETVQSRKDLNVIKSYKADKKGKVIVSGQSVGSKIGSGEVNRIMSVKDITKFKPGQVLLTDMTDPDWEPIMKIASAIVTDKGGRTCHAAIVSRELGIPCVVGTENASKIINNKKKVTIDCSLGELGYVYEGIIPFSVKETSVKGLKKTKTKIMMNIGEPDMAFPNSFLPNDGVGLARLEFIINNYIKIHPLALTNYSRLRDKTAKKEIEALTKGYKKKSEYFVDRLSQGVAVLAAAFYPKDVILRLSDFKSNEYANLIGGRQFEPEEANPMIGFRGASRYYSKEFLPAFKLECQAIKRVRDEMGLKNLKVMVPFCRTIEEGKEVLRIMAENGLKRGEKGLEVYVMAEIPSNIILADEFCKIFDGFSIGSNDLTQLTLGIDRDSGGTLKVLGESNEKNESVKKLIRQLIKTAKKNKKKVGICGQAPSDFPDFAEFLVGEGIDSMSLTPDTVVPTTLAVMKKEKSLKKSKGILSLFF